MNRHIAATYTDGGFDPSWCVYCAEMAEVIDHFVPVVWTNHIPTEAGYRITVPACWSCNATAGGHAFPTLAEKARFIAKRLRIKHRRLIACSEWSTSELDTLGDGLRGQVSRFQANRAAVLRRLIRLDAVSDGSQEPMRIFQPEVPA